MKELTLLAVLSLLSLSIQAQDTMTIGTIDFYGLRSTTEEQVRAALPFSEGHVISPDSELSEEAIEADLAEVLNVARVDVSLACCFEPFKLVAYVGIQETPDSRIRFRDEPTGNQQLPPEIAETARLVDEAWMAAIRVGDSGDDWSQGHSLAVNPEVRALQERYVDYAEEYYDELIEVLHGSSKHRALAAMVLAYSSDKKSIVPHLEEAVLDPDQEVRNNAIRALMIIAAFAKDHPELELEIDATNFVDLLNSIVHSDRHKASGVLFSLTESRDPGLLEQIRTKGLSSLIEMCGWKMEGHSFMPCKVLERVVGLPDQEELHPKHKTIDAALKLTTSPPGFDYSIERAARFFPRHLTPEHRGH